MTDGYEVADVLNRAADLLESNGWCQFALEDDAGAHCAMGALLAVDTGAATNVLSFSPTGRVAFNAMRGRHIATWNNDPRRTKQDVLDAFRSAAKDQMRAADEAGTP